MTNILLNNGELITVSSNNDILEVIGENFSYELVECVSEILWNQEAIDKYITDIEKENNELRKEKSDLGKLISEYRYPSLWNDSYFDYLCEAGRVQTMEV